MPLGSPKTALQKRGNSQKQEEPPSNAGKPPKNGQRICPTGEERGEAVLNFLIAGRSTTAQSLSWTFFLLCAHPHVEKHVLEEIGDLIGDRVLSTCLVLRVTLCGNSGSNR